MIDIHAGSAAPESPGQRGRRLWVLLSVSTVLALAVGEAFVPSPRQQSHEDSETVALLNAEAITQNELHRAKIDLRALGELHDNGEKALRDEQLERLAVHQLLQRQLLLEEAARRNFSVPEDELDEALIELRSRFEDLESFGKWMQVRRLDDRSLMETLRGDLLVRRVTVALVSGVQVTEEQVRAYYEAQGEALIIGEEVRLGIIAVGSADVAEAILTALGKGASLARLAQTYSLGQRAARGGDTGWLDPLTLPPPLRQAVAKLEKGEAYGPLEKNPNEFLVVALADRRVVRAESLAEARPEIERRLLPATRQRAIEQWLAEREEASKIDAANGPERI